jgi:hypothetical protein
MPFTKLQFRPGINREVTNYTNEGGWRFCDKIRFRDGFPESIGGWEKVSNSQFLGTCRMLHSWTELSGTSYIALGTNLKSYVMRGSEFYDITPIRATTAAGDVTFSATSGSTTLTVSDTSHGALLNDFVTFTDAVSLGGNITADVLNAEHQITNVVDADSYTIEVSVAATASDTGSGGSNTIGAYQINTGLDTSVVGSGWGADPWGSGGWGDPASAAIPGATLRLYGMDNYGEDLYFNVRNGGIYYWDESVGLSARAVAISDLSGSSKAPTIARQVMTSDRDRHAIAFGCDDEFSIGTQDPLLIRFSDQENILDWETLSTNTAGSLRISSGSEIVAAVKTRQQILVFTDISLHTMQYIGPPFTFGLTEISTAITLAGPNAAVAVGDAVYWMGEGAFYVYQGTVQKLPCAIRGFLFDNMNISQAQKIYAGHNSEFSEVWWFYASTNSTTNDRYVVYNYAENVWYYGTLGRTAWEQRGVFGYSIAAGTDGYMYYHELGINDGSTNPPSAINAYIESSPMDMGDGDNYMFASRILPDITFRRSDDNPSVTFTVKATDYPGDGYIDDEESETVTRTQTSPVQKFTRQLFIRLRGRSMSLRVESDQYNTQWRLGSPRIEIRSDGRK